MMTSTNDIFSEFEGIRRRMERAWRQVLGPRQCKPLRRDELGPKRPTAAK